MKRTYLPILILIFFGCKSSYQEKGLDYSDYSDFEFSIEEELSKNVYNDSISSNIIDIALPKRGYLAVDYARNLKEDVLTNALYLTNNSNFDYYEQNGLAYVWGGKDHSNKIKPVNYRGKNNKCQEELFGLDCSGFIYQIFLKSGFKFFSGNQTNPSNFASSRFFSNPSEWIAPAKVYCEGYDCLKFERINEPALEDIESGDILFFYNSRNRTSHIGICLEKDEQLIFFDSGGNPSKDCREVIKKGPRRSILSEGLLDGWKRRKHGIIRIKNSVE
jgi:cell wall-associated NlpC family hydrolase